MLRTLAHALKTPLAMAAAARKQVPIPKNGVDYRGKVVLAPMVRSGELPCRIMALRYGADLVWGPETIDKALIGCTRHECPRTGTVYFSRQPSNGLKSPALNPEAKESIIYRLHPTLERGKLIYQIGTANPQLAVQAAKMVAGDVAGIDLNSGCPKPFSTVGGMGAALLKNPDNLCAILTALVEEVGKPYEIGISVKIRILETEEKTLELVRRICQTGVHGVTVHCRTTPMRPRERAIREQLKAIVQTCHEAGVSCTMNGDVENREQALELMKEFGADGAMIATAAEKNHSVFRAEKDGGLAHWREVVRQYIEVAMSVENRWGNTKFTLAQLIPGKDDKTVNIARCKSHVDVVTNLGFTDLLGKAKEVDERLGIGKPELTRAVKRAAAREESHAKKAKVEELGTPAKQVTVETKAKDLDPEQEHPLPNSHGGLSASIAV